MWLNQIKTIHLFSQGMMFNATGTRNLRIIKKQSSFQNSNIQVTWAAVAGASFNLDWSSGTTSSPILSLLDNFPGSSHLAWGPGCRAGRPCPAPCSPLTVNCRHSDAIFKFYCLSHAFSTTIRGSSHNFADCCHSACPFACLPSCLPIWFADWPFSPCSPLTINWKRRPN